MISGWQVSRLGCPGGDQKRPSERDKAGQSPALLVVAHTPEPAIAASGTVLHHAGSDSQALAALGAAGVQHLAAALGLHAHQKAMGAGATGLGGLVGTLHDDLSLSQHLNLRAGRTRDYISFCTSGQRVCAKTGAGTRPIDADLEQKTVDNPVHERPKTLRIRLPRKDLSTT